MGTSSKLDDEERLPPSYEASASHPPSPPTRLKIHRIAIEDSSMTPSMLSSIINKSKGTLVDDLGFTVQREGMYYGLDLDVRDNSALYKLISMHESTPQFYIKINGFQKNRRRKLFSFTIPLPQMKRMQSSIFSKADDCPSMRGLTSCNAFYHSKRMEKLRNRWRTWALQYSRGDETHVVDIQSGSRISASTSSIQQWNQRRKQGLTPPWLALEESVEEEDWLKEADPGLPRRTVRNFLDSNDNFWSRWLVIPQFTHSWDITWIEEELNKMIPYESCDIDSISIEMIDSEPSSSVRLFKSKRISQIYTISDQIPHQYLLFPFLFLNLTIPILGLSGFSNIAIWILLICLPLLVCILGQCLLVVKESVIDSVGLAWALKRWIKTDVSLSFSHDDALEYIRINGPFFSTVITHQNLRRGPDAWYILVGMTEKDWITICSKEIEYAIKTDTNGTLDILYDDEAKLRLRLAHQEEHG